MNIFSHQSYRCPCTLSWILHLSFVERCHFLQETWKQSNVFVPWCLLTINMFVSGFKIIILELLQSTKSRSSPVFNRSFYWQQTTFLPSSKLLYTDFCIRNLPWKNNSEVYLCLAERLSLWHTELPNILHCILSSWRIDLISTQHAILEHDTLLP